MILLKFPRLAPFLAVSACLLLASCTQVSPRTPLGGGVAGQDAREAALDATPSWSFSGRVAIDNGGQGGNARIEWRQQGEDFDITLSAPVTRQSWHLIRQAGQARLEGLEGGSRRGASAEALLLEATGWRIPVDSLARWVRGARAEPAATSLEFEPGGLPSVLSEAGWTVEYRAWQAGQPPLPTRLFARRDQASVRLAIERWSSP